MKRVAAGGLQSPTGQAWLVSAGVSVEEAGAGGYTILPAPGGSGRNGRWSEDRVSVADSKVLLFAIATDETAGAIVRGL